jgi:hypothetical protein
VSIEHITVPSLYEEEGEKERRSGRERLFIKVKKFAALMKPLLIYRPERTLNLTSFPQTPSHSSLLRPKRK